MAFGLTLELKANPQSEREGVGIEVDAAVVTAIEVSITFNLKVQTQATIEIIFHANAHTARRRVAAIAAAEQSNRRCPAKYGVGTHPRDPGIAR